MLLVWDENARDDYLWWQAQDRKVLNRVNTLSVDTQRNGNAGIGKPEALKHDFAGYWSRRITDEHRLVYKVTGDEIRIAVCRYRYKKQSGLGLISDWDGLDIERFDSPAVRVRLALDVINEEARDEVLSLVDERLCHELDADRFAILSTTRIFPGARGGAGDTLRAKPPLAPMAGSTVSRTRPPQLSAKLEQQRQRLVDSLQSFLEALAEYADEPRNKNRRRAYTRQERFETRVEWLHRKVLRRGGTPLVTSWAYVSDELP